MNGLDAKHLVRRLVDEEFLSEYRFVRRMPSTEIWKTLAYLDTLDDSERDTLFDLWAERGSAMLTPVDYERQMELVRHPVYQRFTIGKTQGNPWTYGDINLVRTQPARAADIRREVMPQFRDRFRTQPTNNGGGVWTYAGDCEGSVFVLTMDYGGFIKFRYGVVAGQSTRKPGPYGVSWEGLLGFGLSGWDCVCPRNLSESVSLLGEVIEKLVPLLEEADGQRDR
jgi:hypothetical protein